ncbi:hypothetical protein LEMLEM_LOCUS25614 [Lemmus lemmus]
MCLTQKELQLGPSLSPEPSILPSNSCARQEAQTSPELHRPDSDTGKPVFTCAHNGQRERHHRKAESPVSIPRDLRHPAPSQVFPPPGQGWQPVPGCRGAEAGPGTAGAGCGGGRGRGTVQALGPRWQWDAGPGGAPAGIMPPHVPGPRSYYCSRLCQAGPDRGWCGDCGRPARGVHWPRSPQGAQWRVDGG